MDREQAVPHVIRTNGMVPVALRLWCEVNYIHCATVTDGGGMSSKVKGVSLRKPDAVLMTLFAASQSKVVIW
jgi:hypothetical protein